MMRAKSRAKPRPPERAAGFTDDKVVRFSETHTALRFVIPLAKRRLKFKRFVLLAALVTFTRQWCIRRKPFGA